MKTYRKLGLAGVAAALVSIVMAVSASAATVPIACKLVTPAQAKAILGHPVKFSSGEDTTSCNLVGTAGFDSQLHIPIYSTVTFYLYPSTRKPGVGGQPVAGVGTKAWISSGLHGDGYVMSVVKGSMGFDISAFGGKKSPTKAQVITLAKLIASKL